MHKDFNSNATPAQATSAADEPAASLPVSFLCGRSGRLPLRTVGNAVAALHQDPALASCIGGKLTVSVLGHEHSDRHGFSLVSAPPWSEPANAWGACCCLCDRPYSGPSWPRPFEEMSRRQLRLYLERAHRLIINDRILLDALAIVGAEREPISVMLIHTEPPKSARGSARKGARP